jgi:hypothetical protein
MTAFEILVEYFRYLSKSHNLVKTFKTCDVYEDNNNMSDYPQIHLQNNFTTSYQKTKTDNIDGRILQITFDIICLSNFIVDDNGNNQTVTESTLSNVDNQINLIGIAQKDQLINIPYKIILEFCSKFISDIKNQTNSNISKFFIDSIDIENEARISTDDVYTSKATIKVSVQNLINCDFESSFLNL